MATARFVAVRYGDAADIFLSSDELQRCDSRLRVIWRALTAIVGVELHEPLTQEVHSPRALPAFLGLNRPPDPDILWDAGLGTLFSDLSFTMPYSQPAEVVEALARRVAAVRCIVALEREQAATQMLTADAMLRAHPIDRTYQQRVGAEEQFEIYQLGESQERFALAHELAHYIRAVEPAAFQVFEAEVAELLRSTDYAAMRHRVMTTPIDPKGIASRLIDNDLDPYAGYLHGSVHDDRHDPWPQLDESVPLALDAVEGASPREREEIICDILAASAVCLAAHLRQSGWTTLMAAGSSRLALSNLRAILGIDAWVRAEGERIPVLDEGATVRERCLNAFLPIVVPAVLDKHGNGADVEPNDLHLLMHLVEDRFTRENQAAINSLTWDPPIPNAKLMTNREIVLRAGFMNIRPAADHRTANRQAIQPLFELGSVDVTERVRSACSDPSFAHELEAALLRHQRGEWDELPDEDRIENIRGLYDEFKPSTQERRDRRSAIWSHFDSAWGPVVIVTTSDRTRTSIEFIAEH